MINKVSKFDGWMGSVGEYLYANAGEILRARANFILATSFEPTVLILPPLMRVALERAFEVTTEKAIIWYNMAVICGDVEEPTLGFGVSALGMPINA